MSAIALVATASAAFSGPSCAYSSPRFFARFDTSIVNTFGGGVNIWNASGFYAYDAQKERLRIERQAQVRSLSSGPTFQTSSDSLFVVNSSVHSISADKCSATDAIKWAFPGSACVGSIARFLPPSALDVWSAQPDAFIGYELLNGVNVSKWGWTVSGAGGRLGSSHFVFLDASSGTPLLETQARNLDESYPTTAEVRFAGFETIFGSEIVFDQTSIFKLPLACAWSEPQWNVTSGKPPYDDTAYYCPKGAKLVKAVTHLDKDENAFYTWPTLPATPPGTEIVQVPHEGGPGPEIVCYNAAM